VTARPVDVSIIISAFSVQRWDQTVAAVASALSQTLPPREVILSIDHNSNLLARARAHADQLDERVLIVDNTQSRGVSGARNSAVAVARGEIIAFLDDDAEAAGDWLEYLTRGYVHARVLGVGGSIEPRWMTPPPAWFPSEFNWVVGCSYRGLPVDTAPLRNLIGANMSFRRDAFVEAGGFRNDIGRVGEYPPVGCEDTALCIGARKRWPWGIFLYEPRARVRHSVSASKANWSYFLARCYGEGLSKARLAQLFGFRASLGVEGAYAFRTLPTGVARSLADACLRRDPSGLARGAAIVAGVGSAAAGFFAR
jgi:glycosyltransferase involved in cell wall biosynthesis